MAAIHLKQVRKTYGNGPKAVDVIHGIDAEIADGEFIVMVGPSGCGKSTLLRMVAGLEEISSGQIVIGQRVVNDLEPKERDIAMVFQNYALYPHMTVYQNMAYGLKIQGLSKAEIDERVQRAATILELGALLERTPRQLSGGQRQRVAMGRAIVRKPAVFLFDEPLSNLDAKLRVQMRLEIQKLHASLRTTSLYVTHDQVEAMTLGQRMIVMNRGVAEQIGTPAEVYARPATTFVASFIGSPPMNLLQGRVGADGSGFEVSKGSEADTIRLPQPASAAAGQERILGVRPEHLLPILDGSAAQLSLEVELVEALGAELLVHARCGGQALVLRCPANVPVSTGQHIGASFGATDVHWFDVQSTRRID
ncbi:sn-glycerol-3-phosphate import ATP-binding protein UgpC [Herbaspirillum sp. AP02]|uniref:sn-glycerol-3-phosphate import ATP-binding protein UgpC n=1 Tax=unclassified Herbaspirillum TaxID=2624150 RepID=UPI0015D997C7|nr:MULTISPECIES: sn-glycerol-3-phosphate import ATP-binding protein UgpC [unclassified Herbaspirillum]MBG7621331.1 sn-glycerol-3-phosphate import ATP-binding protein UgpC [Herbaspirillum sp. AP02]NZD66880.1 sn-glycerol-3-phosphate import ATP-binding protein UgpC [Herbaspirillum sp. AP21]